MKIDIKPAIKEETKKLAKQMAICLAVMLLIFLVLHLGLPQSVPFDYTVILAGVLGSVVAVINFLWMGIAVQALSESTDTETGKKIFQGNYRKRMFLMIFWCILVLLLPCFNAVAGIIPLLLPSLIIRVSGAKDALKNAFKKKGDD